MTGGVACAVTVFVNFDGVTLTEGTDDATTDTSSIADGTFAPYAGTVPAEDVFAAFEAIFAPYPVCATDVRPDEGPYAMVVVTADTSPYGPGVGELAGIDCGDGNPKSVALVFENGSVDTAAGIAARIAHAFAHTLGLEHVDEPSDVLNVSSPGTSFVDACSDLVGPQDPVCGAQHEAFCPPGQQNGHAELSALGG
ncbi:MAG: hypothetical protein D6705_01860 [Deltaproteobacteria bacterium]|nr:MAG: hypothetical protein D6705_01860 [Deltaproteobacteria bacterium]